MTVEDRKQNEITQMLHEWSNGDREAIDALIPLVYDHLHQQARRYLRKERQDHTLQTTALIHEAFIKLVDQRNVRWESRTHFFAIAAQAMRRILVDHARAKHREKRGGNAVDASLDDALEVPGEQGRSVDLIALDEALDRLEKLDKQQARIVELRYFSGLSLEDTATALDLSPATVSRDWAMARAWLKRELTR